MKRVYASPRSRWRRGSAVCGASTTRFTRRTVARRATCAGSVTTVWLPMAATRSSCGSPTGRLTIGQPCALFSQREPCRASNASTSEVRAHRGGARRSRDHPCARPRAVLTRSSSARGGLCRLACFSCRPPRAAFSISPAIRRAWRWLSGATPCWRPSSSAGHGLRIPGAWDAFECAVRSVLAERVSLVTGRALAARLVTGAGTRLAAGCEGLTHLFPSPAALASAKLEGLGLGSAHVAALRRLSQIALEGALDVDVPAERIAAALASVPGFGARAAQEFALHALGDPDAFPAGDRASHDFAERHDAHAREPAAPKRGARGAAMRRCICGRRPPQSRSGAAPVNRAAPVSQRSDGDARRMRDAQAGAVRALGIAGG